MLNDIILGDHNYFRRDSFGNHFKPTKVLFSNSTVNRTTDSIDVTTVVEPPHPDYDLVKSLELMDECERFIIFARAPGKPEESNDDWEENIPKKDWSFDQLSLFRRIVKILHADRLARLALKGSWSEPARRRAQVNWTAQKFRAVMSDIYWDVKLTQWLHSLLVEHLDIGYLAAYVDILQTLKARIPTLVDRLLAGGVHGKAYQEGMKLLLKRQWDPAMQSINARKLGKLPGNPVIILIPSGLKKPGSPTARCNLWTSHLSSLATLITVVPTEGTISPKMTIPAYLEQMMSATKAFISNARSDYPGRPIILAGWRSGAAIALQTALVENVAGVVTLGFSTRTVEGPRGDPDDAIYNLTCPVLFVTGEQAISSRPEDLEAIRMKMLSLTGLVVVGFSDDSLRMNRRQKLNLGLTQSLVDRAVLEAVGEFLADALLQPSLPRIDRHQTAPLVTGRKRRLSTDASMDVESLKRPVTPSKQFRQTITTGTLKTLNGNLGLTYTPPKRGRKPGSLNRTPRIPKTPKTLETISPVRKIAEKRSNDVIIDVGSLASLGTTGPILRTGSPTQPSTSNSSTPTTSSLQMFRIQAGRVSTAAPSAVMPQRLSDQSSAGDDRPRPSSPIMTLSSAIRPGTSRVTPTSTTVTPRTTSAVVRAANPATIQTNKPVSRISFSNTSKIVPAHRSVFLMADKRPVASTSAGQVKVPAAFKATPTRLIRAAAPQYKTPPTISRLTVAKKFVPTTSPLQQKPIIIKSRSSKPEESEMRDVPLMIVKSRALDKVEEKTKQDVPLMIVKSRNLEEDKKKVYFQRLSGADLDMPVMIMKNSESTENDRERVAGVKKHVVLASGEEYVVHDPRPAKQLKLSPMQIVDRKKVASKYILDCSDDQTEDQGGFIYEVLD